jgi:hypothetical protein
MSDPDAHDLLSALQAFGIEDAASCFDCENDHAECPLKTVFAAANSDVSRDLQTIFEDNIKQNPEPWLYRHDPNHRNVCPRGVDIDAMMIGLRRYQTSLYDQTGISQWFFTSKIFPFMAILFISFLVGMILHTWHGPILLDKVALNVFAPYSLIKTLNLIVLIVLAIFLSASLFRLFRFIMGDPGQYPELSFSEKQRFPNRLINGIPLPVYVNELKAFMGGFLPWVKLKSCKTPSQRQQYWVHLLIITGCTAIFVTAMTGLRWFQRDEIYALWHPIRLLGYYSTFAILYGTTYILSVRVKKNRPAYQHTHFTDWVSLMLLWLTAFSGILLHAARLLELPLAAYYLYVIHLMIAVSLLLLEIPFANGAMQLYRLVVVYLERVKRRFLIFEKRN